MTAASSLPAIRRVGAVTLLARDLLGLSAFYMNLLGLTRTQETSGEVVLEAHGTPLLRLKAAPELPAPTASRPGLYHTAFLLPTRADLGRWLAHAARAGLRIGSGDHLVSEAFYLSDPEGNGIEVYADRPAADWTWEDGQVRMDTVAVDAAAVLAEAGLAAGALENPDFPAYAGAPAGTRVGHVHLKVGSAAQAARFYGALLGMDVVADLGSAAFLSWDRYHHHLGLNEWHTAGQGRPQTPAAGLGGVELYAPDLALVRERLQGQPDVQDGGDHLRLRDPWGNVVTVFQG
ncbi:VOC family protein [Deinococcus sp. Leaf326]|uniref:VOC family protein n=1 Tax=Deinococcus sp. Leaf326 TaxID=1736338 RepID=UPI0006FC7F9E|nr:VOC family protein [Deinococcus sp. Leaf326]KQR27788.1 glyoxalase [Deinococcus sp. Leaf326]